MFFFFFFFLMIRRPPRSTQSRSSAASDVYKRQRPARTRSGSWTSVSSRPPVVGPGGSPAAGTTGPSTPTGSTSHRPRTCTTRVNAVELALSEAEQLLGRPLVDLTDVDDEGKVQPVVTIVTDNGGPFRSFRFEAPVTTHPELRHVRTRVRTPGQNGSRERGFGSLKYERLFLEEIPDALDLAAHAEDYRVEYNTVRPHEAIAWNHPIEVHLGYADPAVPNFPEPQNLPSA